METSLIMMQIATIVFSLMIFMANEPLNTINIFVGIVLVVGWGMYFILNRRFKRQELLNKRRKEIIKEIQRMEQMKKDLQNR